MKTTLLILLTLFTVNTFAQDFPPHTVLERNIEGFGYNTILFSPDGQTLAGWNEQEIYLWDVTIAARKTTLDAGSPVNSISFSSDGQTLASVTGEEIRLWDVATGTHKTTLEGSWDSVLFSPVGQILASAGNEKIRLWDVATDTPKVTLEGNGGWIDGMSFSPDGQTLATVDGREIDLWDVATGAHKATLEGRTDDIYSVSFSPDGRTLASEGDNAIRLWDTETGTHKATLNGNGVSFSPDGRTLASGNEGKGTIHLWDVETGEPKATLDTLEGRTELITDQPPIDQPPIDQPPTFISITHSFVYTGGSFSPDGKTLASVTGAAQFNEFTGTYRDLWSTIDLWDVDTRSHKTTLGEFEETGVSSILFSPDGQTLAVITSVENFGNFLSTIRLWDFSTQVNIAPSPVQSPAIGEQLSVDVNIVNGKGTGGYQVSVDFDETAFRYVESANGDYLPPGAFAVPPDVSDGKVTIGATSLAGTGDGDGTLATLTFEVVDIKESILALSGVILTDSDGEYLPYHVFNGLVTGSLLGDVNRDGVVNILDLVQVASRFNQRADIGKEDINGDGVVNIVDLVKVAGALGAGAAAPSLHPRALAMFTATEVQRWLSQAQLLNLTDATSQRGIRFLEQLLAALTPKEAALLPNYPNPFNPETWIPYQLAESADVTLRIYAVDGAVVRTLALGHQPIGIYQDKIRAAYWDGRNALGESVASGIYFYTLTAGDFTATRKMLIRK